MMKIGKNLNYNTRKTHRYLGVFIGIQFLLWTLGGIYFSWNNMDDVHGESLQKHHEQKIIQKKDLQAIIIFFKFVLGIFIV